MPRGGAQRSGVGESGGAKKDNEPPTLPPKARRGCHRPFFLPASRGPRVAVGGEGGGCHRAPRIRVIPYAALRPPNQPTSGARQPRWVRHRFSPPPFRQHIWRPRPERRDFRRPPPRPPARGPPSRRPVTVSGNRLTGVGDPWVERALGVGSVARGHWRHACTALRGTPVCFLFSFRRFYQWVQCHTPVVPRRRNRILPLAPPPRMDGVQTRKCIPRCTDEKPS